MLSCQSCSTIKSGDALVKAIQAKKEAHAVITRRQNLTYRILREGK